MKVTHPKSTSLKVLEDLILIVVEVPTLYIYMYVYTQRWQKYLLY